MKNLSKFFYLLFFFLIILFLYTKNTFAQSCNEIDDPEFHSLRPYPGKPCRDSSKALFCSNDLIFTESFDISKFPSCKGQAPDESGPFDCDPGSDGNIAPHNLIVDLSDSEFPILGNTEKVQNSQSNVKEFDDATKVNEYVSWYLNGVTNRAEYGNTKNNDSDIVDYSGPLKKLLPQVIQESQRISIVKSGVAKTENNDQIVVCAQEEHLNIWGKTIPHECYEGNGTSAKADVYRLSSWNGNLSDLRAVLNLINPLDAWDKRTPPLPWSDKDGKAFTSDILYKKAYNEWKGKSCLILPIIGLQCIDNPLIVNKWAELFQYVPLSVMTDKKGEEIVNSITYTPSSGTSITGQKPTTAEGTEPAPLYFAHTQESKDLIGLLNKVFTPMDCKNVNGNLSCNPLASTSVPASTETIACSTVNVRTNPGDDLYPNGPTQFKIPGVTYKITNVPCEVNIVTQKFCNYWEEPNICPGQPLNTCCDKVIKKETTCNAEVVITVKTDSTTPLADEIFESAVADSGSTFRKMFPKVEPGAPVECIADIPSVSSVTYDASNSQKPAGGSQSFDVRNPTTGSIGGPQLTFPHIGSVYEYFLKGIQTALRPKGYGEPIVSGSLCSNAYSEGATCDQSAPDIAIPGLFTKEQTYDLALRWFGSQTPGNQVLECYNDTVRRAQSAGVNVGLTIALWLHESNASNYSLGYMQDFGAYWPSTFPGYTTQINEFFRRAKDSIYTKAGSVCKGNPEITDDFMAWAVVYKSGKCDPNERGAAQFYDEIQTAIQWVSPGCVLSSTTDTCP